MTERQDYSVAPAFSDPKNITVGKARVIYVKGDGRTPGGWILLGGRRTDNFEVAHAHAVQMNALMTAMGA